MLPGENLRRRVFFSLGDSMTTAAIARLRALLDAATPGPWGDNCGDICQKTDAGQGYPLNFYPDSKDVVREGWSDRTDEHLGFVRDEDRAIIVALRNAAPLLLAVAEAAAAYRGMVRPRHPDSCECHAAAEALDTALDALNKQGTP